MVGAAGPARIDLGEGGDAGDDGERGKAADDRLDVASDVNEKVLVDVEGGI
jgi:hypothetical protein